MAHFLVSMLLVGCGFVLHRRAGSDIDSRWWRVPPRELRRAHLALFFLVPVAIVTGTVVTATGPHAGDENAVRFGFALVSVARVHSISVILTLSILGWIAWRVQRLDEIAYRDAIGAFMFVGVLQAGVGWTQYFTGVPVILVAVHIAGATAFWMAWCAVVVAPAGDDLAAGNGGRADRFHSRSGDVRSDSGGVGAGTHG